jgi:hypothetical protein
VIEIWPRKRLGQLYFPLAAAAAENDATVISNSANGLALLDKTPIRFELPWERVSLLALFKVRPII